MERPIEKYRLRKSNFTIIRLLHAITFVFILHVCLKQCEEVEPIENVPDVIPKNNYLIVGDTINNQRFILLSEVGSRRNHTIHLIDGDSILIDSYYGYSMGGSLGQEYIKVIGTKNVQIAMDTGTIKITDYFYSDTLDTTFVSYRDALVSKAFTIDDTISNNLNWSKDNQLLISMYRQEYIFNYFEERLINNRWTNHDWNYLAFRIISTDTTLGWLKMKVIPESKYLLEELLLY